MTVTYSEMSANLFENYKSEELRKFLKNEIAKHNGTFPDRTYKVI